MSCLSLDKTVCKNNTANNRRDSYSLETDLEIQVSLEHHVFRVIQIHHACLWCLQTLRHVDPSDQAGQKDPASHQDHRLPYLHGYPTQIHTHTHTTYGQHPILWINLHSHFIVFIKIYCSNTLINILQFVTMWCTAWYMLWQFCLCICHTHRLHQSGLTHETFPNLVISPVYLLVFWHHILGYNRDGVTLATGIKW